MNHTKIRIALSSVVVSSLMTGSVLAVPNVPPKLPEAVVDLSTKDGVAMMNAQWRYSDAKIIEVDHKAPGPDRKPTGAPIKTNDIIPHAAALDFDDSAWTTIDPTELETRRGTGRICFNWYRIRLTIPDRIAKVDPTGLTVILETVIDDYAEIWVDGKLPLIPGQSGGQSIAGWNSANRVVIARDARPGQQIQLAILGINGPLSDPPGGFIWVRSATLEFHKPEKLTTIHEVPVEIVRVDPALDAVIPKNVKLEKLADGFTFTEGPVWHPDGYLLFSDPNNNVIHRWTPDGDLSLYRPKSGYSGFDMGEYRQPGSNGLALDPQGRLTICEHGNRRVIRIEKNGSLTVLADRYEGKRLNSPNDLTYRSDGVLFFTDPPFGLPKFHDDPKRELPHFGVYCLNNGKLTLLSTDLTGPNGIALSPDEKHLYVTNWDTAKKVVMRYDLQPDGSVKNGTVFFDMTNAPGEEALDGMKIDQQGNLFVSGPIGAWVISPQGKHLGTIIAPELPANFAWGDSDHKTLYLAARTSLYRMRLNTPGSGQGNTR